MKNILKIAFVIFIFNFNKSSCFLEPKDFKKDPNEIERGGVFLSKPQKSFSRLDSDAPDSRLNKNRGNDSKQKSYLSRNLYSQLESQAIIALKFYKKIDFDWELDSETNFNHIFEEKYVISSISDKWEKKLEDIVNVCKQRKKSLDEPQENDVFIISSSYIIGLFLNDMGYTFPEFLEKESKFEHEVIKNIAYKKFVKFCTYKIKEIGIDITENKNVIKKLKEKLEDDFMYIYRFIISGEKPFSTTEQIDSYYDNLITKIGAVVNVNDQIWDSKKAILKQRFLQTGTAILERNIREELKKFISIKFQSWYLQKLKNSEKLLELIEENSKNIKKFDSLLKELEIQNPEDFFCEQDNKKINDALNIVYKYR